MCGETEVEVWLDSRRCVSKVPGWLTELFGVGRGGDTGGELCGERCETLTVCMAYLSPGMKASCTGIEPMLATDRLPIGEFGCDVGKPGEPFVVLVIWEAEGEVPDPFSCKS